MSTRYFGYQVTNRRHLYETHVLWLFLSALFFLVGLSLLLFSMTSNKSVNKIAVAEQKSAEASIEVLIPTLNIEPQTVLSPAMFRLEKRMASTVETGIVTTIEQIQGKYSRSMIIANHPVHQDFLTGVGPTRDLRGKIPEGFRALAIPVDKFSSIGGWLYAGAQVDLSLLTKQRGDTVLKPVVSNIKILSVGTALDPGSRPGESIPSFISILVTPEQASEVQLAVALGSLSVSLRADGDNRGNEVSTTLTPTDIGPHADPVSHSEEYDGTVKIEDKTFLVRPNGLLQELE